MGTKANNGTKPGKISTPFSKAWEAFQETKEYKETLHFLMTDATMKEKYANNIMFLLFTAGWNANNDKSPEFENKGQSAIDKLNKFLSFYTKDYLLTKDEYNNLPPATQGFCSYMQSSWEGSEVPAENHYQVDSNEWKEWNQGNYAAMIQAQDNP